MTSTRSALDADWLDICRRAVGGLERMLAASPSTAERAVETGTAVAGSCCAQWSPDGRYLAYEHAEDGGRVELYDVNVDGRPRPLRVSQTPSDYLSFVWIQ